MRHPSCISAEPRKVRGPSLTSNGSGGSALPPRESPSGLAIQTSRRKHVEQRCSRDEADGTSHRRLAVAAVKGEAECREVDAVADYAVPDVRGYRGTAQEHSGGEQLTRTEQRDDRFGGLAFNAQPTRDAARRREFD